MTGTLARAAAALAVAATVSVAAAGTAFAADPGAPPAGGTPPHASATEKAAAEVRPAIVYLTETFTAYVGDVDGTFYNNGRPITLSATCTGFGVNPQGYVATAGHCVDITSPDGIRADFVQTVAQDIVAVRPDLRLADVVSYGMSNWTIEGQAKGSPIDAQYQAVIGSGTGAGTKGRAVPARVVDFRPNAQGDVALLKIEATDLPSVKLGTEANAAIGTPVLSIGYPASADAVTDTTLEPSNKDGQISTKRTIGSVPFYETSASLSPGMSGGPTVDLEGDVLGVNSAYLRGDQAFNFIAPAGGLNELLARNGVQNQLGPNDTLYRTALDAYYAGHYTDAIAGFDRLLLVDPQHGQAQQFKTEAAKAKERFGDVPVAPASQPTSDKGMPSWLLWTIIGGGSALVLGGVALTIVLLRRRGGAQASVPAPRVPELPAGGWGVAPSVAPMAGLPNAPWNAARPAQPVPARGSDGPTEIVTPADILAAQRPAPSVNGSAPAAASSDGAATTVVSIPVASTCGTCGTTVAPSAAFCPTCGTKRS